MSNLSEMSRLARLAEVLLGQREPEAEKFWLSMPLDLDEDEKEIFLLPSRQKNTDIKNRQDAKAANKGNPEDR